jgi:hypothetical protein
MAVMLKKEVESLKTKIQLVQSAKPQITPEENEKLKFEFNMQMLESNYGLRNFVGKY